MKKVLLVAGVAVLALASVSSAAFSTNLTVGSKGADVTALQNWLITNGFSIPAGATGYFGSQTKAALVSYQKSVGLPAFGFFGPLTQAKLNGTSVVTTTTNTNTPVVTTTSAITTPGAEGILTVSAGPISSSNVNVGQQMVTVATVRAQAQNSDISIQRIQLNLGTDSRIFTKIYNKFYVVDSNGNVLTSIVPTLATVAQDTTNYWLNLVGFNYVVPKGTIRDLSIKADLFGAIDSSYQTSWTINVPQNVVRGIDGAGISLYGPSASVGFSQAITVGSSLIDSARLNVSTDGATPLAAEYIANSGSNNNQYEKLSVFSFNVGAEKDSVLIKNMSVGVVVTGSGSAVANTAYLYDGATLINSAAVSTGVATFSNINYTVAKDTTKTLTVKVDVTSANGTSNTIVASTTSFTALNSQGSTATVSGSATGNSIAVRNEGIEIALVGTPTISKSTNVNNNISTTTAAVTFNLSITARGADVIFGTQSASSTFGFGIYQNDTLTTQTVASSTSFAIPSSGVVTAGLSTGQAFKLAKNNTVTVPVTFSFENRTVAGAILNTTNTFKVGLESVNWASSTLPTTVKSTTFTAGQTAWRSVTAF